MQADDGLSYCAYYVVSNLKYHTQVSLVGISLRNAATGLVIQLMRLPFLKHFSNIAHQNSEQLAITGDAHSQPPNFII